MVPVILYGLTFYFISTGTRLVDEYAKMLSGSHGEGCPWRNKSCDGKSTFSL